MKFLYIVLLFVISVLISSCGEKAETKKVDSQSQSWTQSWFDSPELLDLETNTSLPEKALWDD